MPDTQPTFEQSLQALEDVISRLEAGGQTLDETMALYERGQKLVAACNVALDQAELRLRELRPVTGGGFEAVPFDAEEE